jgi:hypothetical protein
MFIEWWNTDIRFEKNVPHSFEAGYLFIDNINNAIDCSTDKFRDLIRATAKSYNATYRQIETALQEFLKKSQSVIIYFKFLSDNKLYMEQYEADSMTSLSNICCTFGGETSDDVYNPDTLPDLIKSDDYIENMQNQANYLNMIILITSLWYIATSTNRTKYVYEKKCPVVTGRHKDVVNVSDSKTINTPIYDMRKIRVVRVDTLKARKKGWTYSHAFQVHGHFRHYKNGKTVFINSFIKGQNKEFKSQQILLNPSKNKKKEKESGE